MGTNKFGLLLAGISTIPIYAGSITNRYVPPTPHAQLGVPILNVYEVNNVPRIENLRMGYAEERVLRFQNITRAVEARYNLPENILLSMMRQESGGNPLLPNLGYRRMFHDNKINYTSSIPAIGSEFKPHLRPGDGGAGLIHMQPYLSNVYSVKTISDSKKVVDKEQGILISKKLEETNYDLALMAVNDQRFNPVINVDAAGRMLADFYLQSRARTEKEKWDYAIYRYSGRRNYPARVREFMKQISDESHLAHIEKRFNYMNRKATIAGEQLTFEKCLDYYQKYVSVQFDLPTYVSQTGTVKRQIAPLIASIYKKDSPSYKPLEKSIVVAEKKYVSEPVKLSKYVPQKTNVKPIKAVAKPVEPIIPKIVEYDFSPARDSVVAQMSKPKRKQKTKSILTELVSNTVLNNTNIDPNDDLVINNLREMSSNISSIVAENTIVYDNKTSKRKSNKKILAIVEPTQVIENSVIVLYEDEYKKEKTKDNIKELILSKKENTVAQDIDEGIRSVDNIVSFITTHYAKKPLKTAQFYSDNIPALQFNDVKEKKPIIFEGSNSGIVSHKKNDYSMIRGLDLLVGNESINEELDRVA